MKQRNPSFFFVSLLFHGGVFFLAGLEGREQPSLTHPSFYFFELVDQPTSKSLPLFVLDQSHAGEWRNFDFAPQRLENNRSLGSLGLGAPSAQPKLAGADRKFLRAQIFNHPRRNSFHPEQANTAQNHLPPVELKEPMPFLIPPGNAVRPDIQEQEEELSRITKDGDEGHLKPRAPLHHRSAKQILTLASSRMIPDLIDMAPASAHGQAQGAEQGSRAGRRGTPSGGTKSRALWLNTRDQRYLDYFQTIYRTVHPLWAFPKHLEVLLEQGDVVIRFTVVADGSVRNVRIIKSSGYQQFDNIVLAAILQAAPFAPIPGSLGPKLDIIAPFEFSNPMVR